MPPALKHFCAVFYQDDILTYTQLFRFAYNEYYEEITEELTNLLNLSLQIAIVIMVDSHKAALKAIKKVPDAIQRCLVRV